MTNRFATLQAFVQAFATTDNETGDLRRHFDLYIDEEPIGPGVDGTITVLTCCPHGFEYLTHKFGVDGNALMPPEQVEAKKQFMVNEATRRVTRSRARLRPKA
jgi:hypothetical protein